MNLNPTRDAQAAPASRLPASTQRSFTERVELVPLRTPGQIAAVLHLRDGIDLSVHAAAGRDFVELEKKEMRAVSSSASRSTAN